MADIPSDQTADILANIHRQRQAGTVETEDSLAWIDRALAAEAEVTRLTAVLATIRASNEEMRQAGVALTAERDMALRDADEASALYKDLQTRSQGWLRTAKERAEQAEAKAGRWKQGLQAEAEAKEQARRERDEADARAVAAIQRQEDTLAELETAMAAGARAIERQREAERERDDALGKVVSADAQARAFRRQRVDAVKVLSDLLDAAYAVTNADPTHYEVANAIGGPALAAHQLVEHYKRAGEWRSPRQVADDEGTATVRCPHGHVGCCGHHDPQDMPLPPHGPCFGPASAPAPAGEEGQPS